MNTLYFVAGPANGDQCSLAAKARAKIRNSLAWHDGDFIEHCDYVMGDVPAGYVDVDEHELHTAAVKLADEIEDAASVGDAGVDLLDMISDALDVLDHANDSHWTEGGLPAMKAVEGLVGDVSIKRSDVEDARPGFIRQNPEGVALG